MALTDNLVSYWKFDEASGTSASDAVGTNTGTLSGTTFGAGGIINNRALCDGATGSKIDCGSDTSLSITTGDATISFWIKYVTTPGAIDVLVCRMKNSELKGYFIQTNGGKINFVSWAGSATNVETAGTYNSTGVWRHIVVTKSGTTITIYVNGTSVKTGTITDPQEPTTPDTFRWLNYNSAAESLSPNAEIDEAGFWNRALDSTEISSLYNGGAGNSYPFGGGGYRFVPQLRPFAGL